MRGLSMEALPVLALGVALAPAWVRAEARSPLSDAQLQAAVEHALVGRGIEGVTVAASYC